MVARAALFVWTAVTVLAGSAQAASPHLDDATVLYDAGVEAYRAERFDEAAGHFDRAFALFPKAVFLYNAGRAHHQAGRLEAAQVRYERFIALPDAEADERAKAEAHLAEVRATLAERAAETPPEPPQTPLDGPEPTTEPPALAARAEETDSTAPVIGWTLVGVGVASAATGAVFFVLAEEDADAIRGLDPNLSPAEGEAEVQRLSDDRDDKLVLGWVLAGAGAAAAIAGVVVLATSGGEEPEEADAAVRVGPLLGASGGGLSVFGSF